MTTAPRKGQVFIISAASGTGKTTLVSRLLAERPNVCVSVSHTTRPPRAGEEHGRHYYFTDENEFKRMVQDNHFLEWATVYGNYYGTSQAELERLTELGRDVILEIDTQGAAQVRQRLPEAHSIFILPPSLDILAQRLSGRGTETPEVLARRLNAAREEIARAPDFDFVVTNGNLDKALADIQTIMTACRCRASACRNDIGALTA